MAKTLVENYDEMKECFVNFVLTAISSEIQFKCLMGKYDPKSPIFKDTEQFFKVVDEIYINWVPVFVKSIEEVVDENEELKKVS